LAQFASSAGDGVAVQPGDASQQGDTAATVLASEEAGDKPACTFVRSSNEAVEGTVFSGRSAAGVLSAGRTLTGVDDPPRVLAGRRLFLLHRTFTSFGQPAKGAKVIPSDC
jgi:hypothetical protein